MPSKVRNFFKMYSNLRLKSLMKFYDLKYLKKSDSNLHAFRLKNGLNVTVNKNSGDMTTLFEVFINEDYEFGEPATKKINILDIGANVGYFTLYVSKKFPDANVYSFEPFPDTYNRLIYHLETNNVKNVKALNYAVSDFDGISKFYSFEWSGCNTIIDGNYDDEFHNTTSVDCISFDKVSVLTSAEKFEYAKIDCEGSEFPIFLNSSDEAIKRVRKYIIEVHNSDKYKKSDLINRFVALGFRVNEKDNLLAAEQI